MRQAAKCIALALLAALAVSCAGVAPGPVRDEGMRYLALADGADKVRLAYRDQGEGEPVLLLHGFGASSYTWRHLEPALVAAGHRVVTLDLKGFGRSGKPLNERYSIFDQADLVTRFLDRLGIGKVTLVGHSLGGGVSLALALDENTRGRRRVRRLVLIDSVAYAQNVPVAFRILRTPVLGQLGSRMVPLEVQAHVALRLAYYDNSKFDDRDVERYAAPLREKGSRHALIQTARQIMPENLPELSGRYNTIDIPTLVVWCDHDKIVKPHIGLRLHNDLPNSTFRVIRGCGHLPQEEKPEETVNLVRAFLAR